MRGGKPENKVAEDLKVFGVENPPEGWAEGGEEELPERFEVLPENWPAVLVFLACGTQWSKSSTDVPTGVPFDAIEIAMRRRSVPVDAQNDCWERVTWMVRVAVDEFIKRAKKR